MKPYFTFSKSQKLGAVVIAITITILLVILNVDNRAGLPDPFVIDKSEYLIDSVNSNFYTPKDSPQQKVITYVDFNPNKFNENQWVDFGFSPKQAKTIVSYKSKIGGFKKKEDLKKVYVISEKKYLQLEPYIKIPESVKEESKGTVKNTVKIETEEILELLELNSASIEDLIKLKGVGEYTAKGILEYKTKLGGYHSAEQLTEVYGVSTENLEKIKTQISINKGYVTKLKVNELSIIDLKKHPYISWTIASKIIDKRLGGKLTDLKFLLEDSSMTESEVNNLMPYLKF
jgi:competence ComEA-like helix-hairpin-helix protein